MQTGGYNVTTNVGEGFRHLYAINGCAGEPDRVRWIKDVPGMNYQSWGYTLGPPTVTHGIVFVGTNLGHLVAVADPSVFPAVGWRCNHPDVPSASCVANGFSLVPDPAVLLDLDLHAGNITTEVALVGDPVFVSTEGGKVVMLKTN